MAEKEIIGVGAALVDLLLEESDAFLSERNIPKGGMNLTEAESIEQMILASGTSYKTVPGGSACNTLVGIAKLGGKSAFLGRAGSDELGDLFKTHLVQSQVRSLLRIAEEPTGRVLSVITPDAQRTMFTCLGASAGITTEHIDENIFENADIVYIEGYLAFNVPVFRKVLELAKSTGAEVALDLASFDVVNFCKPLLEEVIPEYVDILIANEDEALAFTGLQAAEALNKMKTLCKIAIVKNGKKGALISAMDVLYEIKADVVKAIDTTGAGDLWAAGFLYGYTQGYDLNRCGAIGARVAAEVVQVIGTVIPDTTWSELRAFAQ
jgi:sugar/nucleoside kinase (ribokinase family)